MPVDPNGNPSMVKLWLAIVAGDCGVHVDVAKIEPETGWVLGEIEMLTAGGLTAPPVP